eukprot:SAG31_NODE_127_length_23612_cov_39.709863_18_plen_176_part_00
MTSATSLQVGGGGGAKNRKTDLSRDVIKSTDGWLAVPELGFEVQPGTLGGLFTTVEGLLTQAKDQLQAANQMDFSSGDAHKGLGQGNAVVSNGGDKGTATNDEKVACPAAALAPCSPACVLCGGTQLVAPEETQQSANNGAFAVFIKKLEAMIAGETDFTFVLRDPTGEFMVSSA